MRRAGESHLTTWLLGGLIAVALWATLPTPDAVRRQVVEAIGSVPQPWYVVDSITVALSPTADQLVVTEIRQTNRPVVGTWNAAVVTEPLPGGDGVGAAAGTLCVGSGTATYAPEKGGWLVLPLDEYVRPGCSLRLDPGRSYIIVVDRSFTDLETGETWRMPRARSLPFAVPADWSPADPRGAN